MYSVTQVTESGTPVSGVALSNGQRRKGRCHRGVGTGPYRVRVRVRRLGYWQDWSAVGGRPSTRKVSTIP